MDHHCRIHRAVQVDLIICQIARDLCLRNAPVHQGGVEILLQKWQTLHVVVAQLLDIALFVHLLIQRLFDPHKDPAEFIRVHRL